MDFREIVLRQINHKETDVIPYTLEFRDESTFKLDEFYGDRNWKRRIKPYISKIWIMDCQQKIRIDNKFTKDIYGTVWREDGAAAHIEKPIMEEPGFENFRFPEISEFFKHDEYEKASDICSSSKNSFSLVHIPWGIFEKSWSLRGFENALLDMVENPGFYEELIDRITEHIMEFVNMAVRLPVDGIMFGDDWGGQTGLLMGEVRWRSIFKPRYKKLFDMVHESGKYVLTHCCGNIVDVIPDLIEIGLDVYESFQPETMDIFGVKEKYGGKITFWGGLGAQSVIPFGTPEDIKRDVAVLRSRIGKGGGFIMAPSKEPEPETPVENLVALLEAFTE